MMVKNLSEELNELRKISKILTLAHADALENELSKYAKTDERKKVWVLINGERTPDELMKKSGLKQSAFYAYLKSLVAAEFIEMPFGKAPNKKFDFVPASWVELLQVQEKGE